MKRYLIIICMLCMCSLLRSQDYYYSDNRKININKADHWIVIQVAIEDRSRLEKEVTSGNVLKICKNLKPERGIYWSRVKGNKSIHQEINKLKSEVEIIRTIPSYYVVSNFGDTAKFIMSDEFRVKFYHFVTKAEIDKLNEQFCVEILNSSIYDEYTLRVKEQSPYNTLELANIYYENELTEWSLPDFLADMQMENINDPLFDDQWYLKNTGQNSGTADVDIDAELAWDITKGNSDIIIAIMDDGVEEHEDLSTSRFVEGYTATGGDGSPISTAKHGQCVAGIAAATFNSTGVRGVANDIKIMSIDIEADDPTNSQVAAAIDTAWINGADILNFSWGKNTSEYWNDDIAYAIRRADTLGRDGKGCLIVKSAGNNGSFVTFPGTVDGVLVVGAVDNDNELTTYTPEVSRVDVVAPSSTKINDLLTPRITTIDRMGSYGYKSSSNYFEDFGGTSACAPQASGVGALILSINPNLEARSIGTDPNPQVLNTIKYSATYCGSETGYGNGRINAYDALVYTLENFGGTLIDSVKLHSSLEIGSGATINITSDAVIDLNSNTIETSGGTISIESGATIIPSIKLKTGSSVVGLYPSLSAALSDASSGQTIEISVNDTLTASTSIPSGITVKYSSGKSLITSAALNATNVTFSNISGTWGGIKYLSGSSGTLNNCTISNSTYGVYCNSASPTIMYSDISNCTYGIYNNNASPTISGNDISGSTYDIYCYDSSPIIKNNDISGGTISLYCDNSSSPELLTGGNDFHNSYVTFGVWADDGSNPNLGDDGCSLPGNHSFEYTMYDVAIVHAGTNCSIKAEKNWWGTSSPSSGMFSGSVDWNPYRTSAPVPLAPNPEGNLYDQNISFSSIAPDDNGDKLINYYNEAWPLDLKIDFLRYLVSNGEALGVPTLCKDIIESYPYALEAFLALDIIYQITKKENIAKDIDKESMKTYLKTFDGNKGNKMLNGSALLMLAGLEKGEGISRINAVYAINKDNYLGPYALYQKFMYYYHDAEDLVKAKQVLAMLDSEYPDDRVTFEAHLLMGDNKVDARSFYTQYFNKEIPDVDFITTGINEIIPEEYSLKAAYPNPFNPTTTLEFALPTQSEVNCSIYDVSGNLVTEYNFNQNAGTHSIVWDGSEVSSGIYLIRFTAEAENGSNSFVEYQKVTLLK